MIYIYRLMAPWGAICQYSSITSDIIKMSMLTSKSQVWFSSNSITLVVCESFFLFPQYQQSHFFSNYLHSMSGKKLAWKIITFENNKLSLLAAKQTKASGTSYCTCLCFFELSNKPGKRTLNFMKKYTYLH